MVVSDGDYLDAMRAGVRLANSRGVTAVHDKDGWLGALRLWQQLEERGQLTLRVWQSIPHDALDAAVAVGLRSGFGSPHVKLGYLKVFMDGTLGSQTAWMLDGSGVQITSGGELAEIVRRGAAAGFPVAVHAIGDRANREALDAFEQTRDVWAPLGLRQRIEHAQLLAAGGRRPLRRARRHVLGAVLACTVRSRPRRRPLGGQDRRGVCVPVPAPLRRGRRQRQRRADRGARPARGHPRRGASHDRRPPRLAPRADADRRRGISRDVRRALPGSRATSAAEARCCRATTPTSSCSTATRGTTSTPRSSRPWSAAAGCTTPRPGERGLNLIRVSEPDSRVSDAPADRKLPDLVRLRRITFADGFASALRGRNGRLAHRGDGQVVNSQHPGGNRP